MPFATYIDVPGAKPGDKYQINLLVWKMAVKLTF